MSGFKKIFFNIICVVFFINATQAQDNYSPKQLKSLARSAEVMKDYYAAIHYYNSYLEAKPSEKKARYALATNYRLVRNYLKAEAVYKVLIEQEFEKEPLLVFYYANMLKTNGKCEKAIPIYQAFMKDYRGEKDDRRYIKISKNAVLGCESLNSEQPSRKITITQLNEDINGAHMEASPIYLSEDEILFNSLKLAGENNFAMNADSLPVREFYIAAKNQQREWSLKGDWALSPKVENSQLANGSFNLDKTRFYFSACKTSTSGKVNCDIYVLDLSDKSPEPVKLPDEVNSKYTETQVAVGLDFKDREVVYFVSDRKEGKGGLDIWYSTYDAKRNTYKSARNCGSKVNSVGDELTPFINPRNRKLFFSSNGHPGYGQLDVFEAAGERSKWSEPLNMGNAVNGGNDELYYIESIKGGSGFFVSNRKGKLASSNSSCCDDLYYFVDTESILRDLSGDAREKGSNVQIKDVHVKIYALEEGTDEKFLIQTQKTDDKGAYSFSLDPNVDYLVIAEKKGYYKSEKKVSTKDYRTKLNYSLELELTKITNQAIVIDDIYYEFNKSTLTEEAKITIDTTILPMMRNNPQIVVEIGSYTDDRGTDGYNKKLSQERAESVVKYLRKNGIAKNRMIAKGYGKLNPVALNKNSDGSDNPEGRAKNRRTEFKVIGTVEVVEEED